MAREHSPVQDQVASTFLERGVAVPFTTPVLGGGRVRPMNPFGLEIVVPNPSGSRGHYVLPLPSLEDFCSLTVHDRLLREQLCGVRVVTPASIRRATRMVAADGMAGREAARAAVAGSEADEHDRVAMNCRLMLDLVRRVEPAGAEPVPIDRAAPEEVERRARLAVGRVAPLLGSQPADINQGLEELGCDFARIGLGPDADQARIPHALAQLIRLRQELEQWARAHGGQAEALRLLIEVAGVTIEAARATLTEARLLGQDVVAALRARLLDPGSIARLLARPEWLLDGWGHVCGLWQLADVDEARTGRINEMMALLPVLPRETTSWTRVSVDLESLGRRSRTVELNVDWRTTMRVFDLVAQNEQILALAG